jgi:hypothetical protein
MIPSRSILLSRRLRRRDIPLGVQPALGKETVRVGVASGVEVDAVGVREDDGSLGDEMAVVDVVFGGCMGEALGGNGAVTLDFFDNCTDVR